MALCNIFFLQVATCFYLCWCFTYELYDNANDKELQFLQFMIEQLIVYHYMFSATREHEF